METILAIVLLKFVYVFGSPKKERVKVSWLKAIKNASPGRLILSVILSFSFTVIFILIT